MATRFIAILMILASLVLLPHATFAYSSNICTPGTRCAPGQVGPFMKGITAECGNSGTCSLDDILLVFANVGNYITGIVGVIVLLMYTIGGFNILIGDRLPDIKKGKEMIHIATVGLLIVFFAYTGISALKNVIIGGSVFTSSDETVCGAATGPVACGDNQQCDAGLCKSICSIQSAGLKECISVDPDDPDFQGRVCTGGGCPNGQSCCDPGNLAPGEESEAKEILEFLDTPD